MPVLANKEAKNNKEYMSKEMLEARVLEEEKHINKEDIIGKSSWIA